MPNRYWGHPVGPLDNVSLARSLIFIWTPRLLCLGGNLDNRAHPNSLIQPGAGE